MPSKPLSQDEIMAKFKEFEEDMQNAKESKWSIKDEGTALWAANRISLMKFNRDIRTEALIQQRNDWKRKLEERVDEYNSQIEDIENKYKSQIEFFSYHLQVWCLAQKEKDPKYSFTHPEVKVKFSTPQAKLIYDESIILKWAKDNGIEELVNIKHEETIKKDEFKKRIEESEIIDEETGEIRIAFVSKDTQEELDIKKETFSRVAKIEI